MYDANTHYLRLQRTQKKRSTESAISLTDNRAAERIMPGLKEKTTTRLDRILKPYRGRSYEGPTEPEVV